MHDVTVDMNQHTAVAEIMGDVGAPHLLEHRTLRHRTPGSCFLRPGGAGRVRIFGLWGPGPPAGTTHKITFNSLRKSHAGGSFISTPASPTNQSRNACNPGNSDFDRSQASP